KSHAGQKLLLPLLVSFFHEEKCSAVCAAWLAEACHQLSNLSFVFCGRKPSSEATPYDIKYPLLSSGRPETDRKPEKSSERKRERREKNLLKKLVERFRKNQGRESWRFGVLKLRITHVLQPLILIGKDCSDQSDPCGDFKSKIFQKPSVISLSSSIVFLSQSHGFKILLYTHSLESFRITVNCSCDTEQDHEDTMMGSHRGGRVTACSVRCSILEYLMEMVVIFIFPLGSVSLGGFPGDRKYSENLDRPSRNIDRVISDHLRSGMSHSGSLIMAIKSLQSVLKL
ncbi:hypothetical protein IGI04_029983, partial [Brassica rapa subsp. trilocularis]